MEHLTRSAAAGACWKRHASDTRVRRHILVGAALVSLVYPALAQPIYKWVDDKGVTQYTTTPPPSGKAQTIRTPPAGAKTNPEAKTWKEQDIEFRARHVERAEAQQKQEQAENRSKYNAALKREACIDAHHGLETLQQQRPVYSLNEKGERQYLDDAQRVAAMRKHKAFIDQECQK